MRSPTLFAGVFLCLSASACHRDADHARTSVYDECTYAAGRASNGVLTLCGQLNDENVSALLGSIEPADTQIIITSGGGFPRPAMKLARVINAKNIGVVARKYCLSACSIYVLLTADKVTVEPDTLVAFHHTGAFAYDVIAARTHTPASHPIWGQSRAERAFFTDAGLSPDLLDRIALAVEPTCMGLRHNGEGREMFLGYRWAWFVPTRGEAKAIFHGRLTGYWPNSEREAQGLLSRLRDEPDYRLRYGNLPKAVPAAVVASSLPACPGST